MKIHQLYYKQSLSLSQTEAWSFFTSPHHLNTITPDFFSITPTSNVPDKIYSGLLISYRMKAVFAIPMSWLSEISHCDAPHYFVYQQQVGPFKFWSHEVRLTETKNGTLVEDIVFYTMPFGWLGEIFHHYLIADKLKNIFEKRSDYLKKRWG